MGSIGSATHVENKKVECVKLKWALKYSLRARGEKVVIFGSSIRHEDSSEIAGEIAALQDSKG